jgi:hypothetical protein
MCVPGKFNIKAHTLAKKRLHILISVKDGLGLKIGVYSIPCERGKVCVGQTGQSIEISFMECTWHLFLYQPYRSAVVELSTESGHCIIFQIPRW